MICLKASKVFSLNTGSTSYQNALSVDAKVEGEGYGAKFSASAGFKTIQSGYESQKIFVESVAKCIQYKAALKRGIKVRLWFFAIKMEKVC